MFMLKTSKLWVAAIAIIAIISVGCGTSQSGGSGTTAGSEYVIKHEWPKKPKVGDYTLKVNLVDNAGAPVKDAYVVVSYDMPSMRGAHATTADMKQNTSGDYLLPIHFAMRGDWEIVVSVMKDGVEVATKTILLDI